MGRRVRGRLAFHSSNPGRAGDLEPDRRECLANEGGLCRHRRVGGKCRSTPCRTHVGCLLPGVLEPTRSPESGHCLQCAQALARVARAEGRRNSQQRAPHRSDAVPVRGLLRHELRDRVSAYARVHRTGPGRNEDSWIGRPRPRHPGDAKRRDRRSRPCVQPHDDRTSREPRLQRRNSRGKSRNASRPKRR